MVWKSKQLEAYRETVWAIAASKYVEEYLIGFTGRPRTARFGEYRAHGYNHAVILEDRMTRKDALDLEAYLQKAVCVDQRQASYRKYNKKRRCKPARRNFGGRSTTDPTAEIHSVYMAWWEP
jgi:hypothetical protein